MAGPSKTRWPNLHRDWVAYGHSIEWDALFDFKSASTHHFVALAWKEGDEVNYATLASGDRGQTWEMQDDSRDPIPLAQWKRMKVAPECDWLVDPKGEDA